MHSFFFHLVVEVALYFTRIFTLIPHYIYYIIYDKPQDKSACIVSFNNQSICCGCSKAPYKSDISLEHP